MSEYDDMRDEASFAYHAGYMELMKFIESKDDRRLAALCVSDVLCIAAAQIRAEFCGLDRDQAEEVAVVAQNAMVKEIQARISQQN